MGIIVTITYLIYHYLSSKTSNAMSKQALVCALETKVTLPEFFTALGKEGSWIFNLRCSLITRKLNKGVPLHKALSSANKEFSLNFRGLIYIGEQTGDLSRFMPRAIECINRNNKILNNIRHQMAIYSWQLTIIFITMISFLIIIVPKFQKIFIEMDMDPFYSLKILMTTITHIESYWYIYFIISGMFFSPFTTNRIINSIPILNKLWQLFLYFFPFTRNVIINKNLCNLVMATALISDKYPSLIDSMKLASNASDNWLVTKKWNNAIKVISSGAKPSSYKWSRKTNNNIIEMLRSMDGCQNIESALLNVADGFSEAEKNSLNIYINLAPVIMTSIIGSFIGCICFVIFKSLITISSNM